MARRAVERQVRSPVEERLVAQVGERRYGHGTTGGMAGLVRPRGGKNRERGTEGEKRGKRGGEATATRVAQAASHRPVSVITHATQNTQHTPAQRRSSEG